MALQNRLSEVESINTAVTIQNDQLQERLSQAYSKSSDTLFRSDDRSKGYIIRSISEPTSSTLSKLYIGITTINPNI